MNTSEQIISVLEYLGEKFGIVIDWTSAEVIPTLTALADKFVKWEIATSIMWIGFALLMGVLYGLFVFIYHKCADPDDRWDFDYNFTPVFIIVLGIGMLIVMLSIIGEQVSDIITASIFPEKMIYDYISSMISQ